MPPETTTERLERFHRLIAKGNLNDALSALDEAIDAAPAAFVPFLAETRSRLRGQIKDARPLLARLHDLLHKGTQNHATENR